MSSHTLDVSGARPLTTTTNDPASTRIWMPSKPTDDVAVSLSGFRELRVELADGARIQRRRYVKQEVVYENGKPKPNPVEADRAQHPYEMTPVEYDRLILVTSGISGFGRVSQTAAEMESDEVDGVQPSHGLYPHTQVIAKRQAALHYFEEGVLVSEQTVAEALAEQTVRGGSDEVGTPDTLTPGKD
jgi:hypothetical protein